MSTSTITPVLNLDPDTLLLSTKDARAAAQQMAADYQSKQPFHYGGVDNFLHPEILDRVREELKQLPEAENSYDRPQERLKTSYVPERLPPYTRQLFYALNSRAVLAFVEEVTGIKGLIPDPYFAGGGIHVVANGGHLDIHADFNHHAGLNLERRVNMLIYLNKDWREEYGGSFEVWDENMSGKLASYVPLFNRMCMFSTSSDSWHGNPEPVNHPDGEPRMSIALYYYTATWDSSRKSHTTLFKPRPGSKDQRDRQVARRALLQDLLPPMLHRKLAWRLEKLGF
ncbi:2OG-Fe(II) oxygenase [Arenibacterium sp. LLYu02]|uniref:2OG-Fe(II) oxygenase n=1 Tax=Arenibacterium sp. LLYu02 TaxID=3404132 RepID=UPI003B212E48